MLRGDPNKMTSGFRVFLVWGIVTSSALFLFAHLRTTPRSPDEQAYLAWSVAVARDGKMAEPDGEAVKKHVPPLHCLLVGFAFKTVGVEVEVAQAVSVLGGALCVGVCFLLGYLILGLKGGLLTALLMMTSGKGEVWEYSNRVLNDIHLTMWVSCVLLCAVAYVKRGGLWTALASGLFFGLGFLTKESVVLTLPMLCAAFLMGREPRKTRLLHFSIAVAVAGCLMAPLLMHRYKALSSRGQGVAPRGGLRAGNLTALMDSKMWGFRGVKELGDNLLLRGMPSGALRVIYGFSLLACLVLLARKTAPREMSLPLILILVWIGVFQTLVHLPLTRRQLLPLFPAYNLVAAFVICRSLDLLKSRFLGENAGPKALTVAGSVAMLGIAFLNMPPKAWPQVTLGKLFKSPGPGFLEKETTRALACTSDAALLASNFHRALYFLVKGQVPVLHLQIPTDKESREALDPGRARRLVESNRMGKALGKEEDHFSVPERFRSTSPVYGVIFCPGQSTCQFRVPPHAGGWKPVCGGEGFSVFSLASEAHAE